MAALASKSGEISRLAEPRGSVAMPAALLLAVGPKLGWTAEVTITTTLAAMRQNRVVLNMPEGSVRRAPKCLIYRA